MPPGKESVMAPFTGLLNLKEREYSESLSKDKKLKLSKLISRSGHVASAKSCLRKIFKYNYRKPNDCVGIT